MTDSANIQFKTIFDKMDQSVYISDPETYEILYANDKIRELFSREIIGEKCYKILQNLDSPCSFCTNTKLFGKNPITPYIWDHYNQKLKRWYHCIDEAIDWKGDKRVRLEIAIDITKYKIAEEKLKESEKNYRDILENTKDAIITFKFKQNELRIPYQLTTMLGRDENNILKEMFSLFHPEDMKWLINMFKNTTRIHSKKKVNIFNDIEFRLRHSDGHYVWFATTSKNYYDENGNVIGFITSLRDISEKKKTEQKLRESEEIFRSISDQSLMGIIIIQDEIVYANDKAIEIFEYSREEMSSWNENDLKNIIFPIDLPPILKVLEAFKDRNRDDKLFYLTIRIITKSGKLKWTEHFAKPLEYKDNIAILNIFHDITDRKEVEEKLGESEENYRIAFDRANFLKEIVTHDFNNILNNIGSAIDLIDRFLENSAKKKEFHELIKEQVFRGEKLIKNIRKLSQFEEQEMNIEIVNIFEILDEAVNYVKKSYKSRNLDIKIEFKNKNISVLANSLLLDIFENIMINSIKYNSNQIIEIKITISQSKSNDVNYVNMEFIDNGIGIPDIKKARIFDTEIKPDIKKGGMGVGLSLVKRAIDCYYGKIWVEDRIKGDHSKGTKFIILIPKAE